jgi:hypothetical protein
MALEALSGTVADRIECTRAAFAEAGEATRRWTDVVRAAAPSRSGLSPYHRAWRGFDKAAGRH